MRGIIVLTMLAASLGHAAWNDYVEVRDLRLDAESVSELAIEAGPGSLDVRGDAAAGDIVVTATIVVSDDEDDARKRIEEDLVLTLEQSGDRAVLLSRFESRRWGWGDQPAIALEVQVPERLALSVDDGSGSTSIRGVRGDIDVTDGSGSLSMREVGGNLSIRDGSGSITIIDAGNDVRIVDGSGSIDIEGVGGSVIVDDGSGGIDVSDVARDLIIEDDGSGSLRYSRIQGQVDGDT